MLFILILLALTLSCFFFYKNTRRPILALITIFLLIFLILECTVYGYFMYQCYLAKGFFLIGNQLLLDNMYKARLIYATYYSQYKKYFYYGLDNELGYTMGRNKDVGTCASNYAGFRGKKEYTLVPKEGILRMACFGDSFVHCDGEKNEDTWEYYLEKSVGNLEVLNFGVGGYGLTQSYLRYLRDGLRFCPHIVFSNYVKWGPRDNDVDFLNLLRGDINLRGASLYRVRSCIKDQILVHQATLLSDIFDPSWRNENIYNKLDFYKENKFLSNKILSLSNVGLLLKVCYIKYKFMQLPPEYKDRVFNAVSGMAKEYNLRLLENYKDVAKRNNSILTFVVNGDVPPEFSDFFQRNKECVRYYNISDYFKRESDRLNPAQESILNNTNHYNVLGNKIYAAAILDMLKENDWPVGNKIFYYDPANNSFLCRDKNDGHQ